MRPFLYVFILIITMWGCSSGSDNAKNDSGGETTLKVDVANLSKKVKKLYLKKKTLTGYSTHDSTERKKKGRFTLKTEIPEAGYYRIQLGKGRGNKVFLVPGGDLKINGKSLKEGSIEGVSFKGSSAKENQTYQKLYSEIGDSIKSLYKGQPFPSQEDFEKSFQRLHQKRKDLLSQLEKDDQVHSRFVELERKGLPYRKAYQYSVYTRYFNYHHREDTLELDPSFKKIYQDLTFDDPELLGQSYYQGVMKRLLRFEASRLMQERADAEDLQMHDLVVQEYELTDEEKIPSDKIRNTMKYKILSQGIKRGGIKGLDRVIKDFYQSSPDRDMKEEIEKLEEKWDKLAEGKPAPRFAYPDSTGDTLHLDELEGKLVYVDVWATWCGPCKKEIPHLKTMVEKYNEEPIEFVSVSIDEKQSPWQMIRDREMNWKQVWATQAWKSKICEDYMIRGIPRFLLIDQEGKIIDAQAPRPSSEEIHDLLETHLGQQA